MQATVGYELTVEHPRCKAAENQVSVHQQADKAAILHTADAKIQFQRSCSGATLPVTFVYTWLGCLLVSNRRHMQLHRQVAWDVSFGVEHCLLVLAFAFDCPLATSGAATCSLSRRMLVSDKSLSLKMTYALNLSSSHSMPAHRQGFLLIVILCTVHYSRSAHSLHCKIASTVILH